MLGGPGANPHRNPDPDFDPDFDFDFVAPGIARVFSGKTRPARREVVKQEKRLKFWEGTQWVQAQAQPHPAKLPSSRKRAMPL